MFVLNARRGLLLVTSTSNFEFVIHNSVIKKKERERKQELSPPFTNTGISVWTVDK